MGRFRPAERGLTLIETIVALTIVAIISTLLGRLFLAGVRTQLKVSTRAELLADTRRAMYMMRREIREIKKPEQILNAEANRFKFLKRGTDLVDYRYENQKLQRNSYAVLSGVTQFQFIFERADGAQITTPADSLLYIWNIRLRLRVTQDGENIKTETSVHPRNF